MDSLRRYLPLLIPLVMLDLSLRVVAFVDLMRRERVKGPKWAWGLAVLSTSFIGAVLYFVLGREE